MRTQLIHGSRRAWRAASLAASGAAVVLTIGALGAAPAQAGGGGGGGDEGQLVPVFVVQPSTTQVHTAVMPTVEVKLEYGNGQQDWNYDGPVVLKYAVNRLGAPLPTGNDVNASDGIAKFPDLTFSTVGFGFELEAEIPGQPEGQQQPWPWPSGGPGWGWIPSQGPETSTPSSPFDIVGQLLQCGEEEGPCRTETVSSGPTSGFSTAPNESGTLTATGGGFPSLSCTHAGGVVSFYSNLSQTIKVTFAGSLGGHAWPWWSWHKKPVSVCFGSTEPFTTKFGFPARFNPANGEFEGLLPDCSAYRPAPCLSSVWSWDGSVKVTIEAPAGDPHITF
jgi:hypothetical protein